MGEETTIEIGTTENKSSGCPQNWAFVMRFLGGSGALTLGVVSFMDMLTQLLKPNRFFFDLFMIVFCLFSLLGEFWNTQCMQGFGYSLLKHTYFITTYFGRGIWYIFIGTCNLDDFGDKPFTVIVGIYMISVGVIMLGLVVCMGKHLPKYNHPDHMKAKDKPNGQVDSKNKKKNGKEGDANTTEQQTDSDRLVNEDDLDPYEKRLLAEERRKQQEKNSTYKIANPFGEGNPYASVASTVVRNGDASAVARAVVKGDNTTAASTVAKSVVLGPQSNQKPSNYSSEPEPKKKGDDDDDEVCEAVFFFFFPNVTFSRK